jgi:outer membrane receptor for ferric coprogen and ferric-rhodotorulic acid
LKLPGFIRFDAAVYARITENWKARLNVENIFNKHYWASADGNNNISPGQGRTIRFTTFVQLLSQGVLRTRRILLAVSSRGVVTI